jgi:hypothetical protein
MQYRTEFGIYEVNGPFGDEKGFPAIWHIKLIEPEITKSMEQWCDPRMVLDINQCPTLKHVEQWLDSIDSFDSFQLFTIEEDEDGNVFFVSLKDGTRVEAP